MGVDVTLIQAIAAIIQAVATVVLVVVTAIYAYQTHKILNEQKKTSEFSFLPEISFSFKTIRKQSSLTQAKLEEVSDEILSRSILGENYVEKEKSYKEIIYETTVNCCVKRNSIYELSMGVIINEVFKGEKKIWNIIINPDELFQCTGFLDISEFLRDVRRGEEFELCLEISYTSRSASKISERYYWDGKMGDDGIIEISKNSKERKYTKAPWLKNMF